MVDIQALIDDSQCFQSIRELRRPGGMGCPECGSVEVTKNGRAAPAGRSRGTTFGPLQEGLDVRPERPPGRALGLGEPRERVGITDSRQVNVA
jgi:hypothetical protein